MPTDLLPHIADQQFDLSIFNATCHSIAVGPVKATFCVSPTPLSVDVTLDVFEQTVARCQLSSSHPSCTIGGSFHGAKAELVLMLDISGRKLNYKLTACVPILGCKSISGHIPV